MFYHQFIYTFKSLLRNRELIFWTLAFPLMLGTFFKLAFQDIEKNEQLNPIDIAIVDSENFQNDQFYVTTFQKLSDSNDDERLFNVKYTTLSEATDLLETNKITGYLILEEQPSIVVKDSGINETVFKKVVDEIENTKKVFGNLLNSNQGFDPSYVAKIIDDLQKQDIVLQNVSNSNLSYTMIEFYSLIAMTCLYGGMLAMTSINNCLADMGPVGKRTSLTPVSKTKLVLASLSASYLIQLLGLALLFIYTVLVLGVDYGHRLPLIILLGLCGSLAGLTIGLLIAVFFRKNDNAKTGILISCTMIGCFLSGMMGITMKYIVDKNVPFLNMINPSSMITDGFYALYYYDTLNRFIFDIISLLIFSLCMIILSINKVRRVKYDSI